MHSIDVSSLDTSKFYTVAEALNINEDACVICSSEHPYVVIMANKRWTSITGYEQHEVEGKTLSLLHGQWTDRDTLRQMMEDVRYGGFGHCTVVNYTKEGKPFLNRISIQPLLAGRQGERNKPLKISHFLGKSVALEIDKNVTLETLTQQMKDDLYWMETNVVSDREANSSSSGDENSSIDSDENNEKHFTSAVKNRGKAGNPSVVSNNSPPPSDSQSDSIAPMAMEGDSAATTANNIETYSKRI